MSLSWRRIVSHPRAAASCYCGAIMDSSCQRCRERQTILLRGLAQQRCNGGMQRHALRQLLRATRHAAVARHAHLLDARARRIAATGLGDVIHLALEGGVTAEGRRIVQAHEYGSAPTGRWISAAETG